MMEASGKILPDQLPHDRAERDRRHRRFYARIAFEQNESADGQLRATRCLLGLSGIQVEIAFAARAGTLIDKLTCSGIEVVGDGNSQPGPHAQRKTAFGSADDR
jgi:hypothetical protein